MYLIYSLLGNIFRILKYAESKRKSREYHKKFDLHPTVTIGNDPQLAFIGNIKIDEGTYFNSGSIVTGENSKVQIGKWCAIGYNVNIIAMTHSTEKPVGPEVKRPKVEKDIIIGDYVWIGSNVFIREGVSIGNNAIIGANSVVTKDIPSWSIVGGVPAKTIKVKSDENIIY